MRVLVICDDPVIARRLAPYLPEFEFSPVRLPGPWDLVVRWGCADGTDPDCRVLNPSQGLAVAQNPREVHRLCHANRIPCAGLARAISAAEGGPEGGGRYRVDLFDLSTLAVSRWDGSRYRLFPWRGNRRIGVLRQVARRALYACGLHFGSVDLGVTSDRRVYVLRVNGGPRLTPYLARQYAYALQDYARKVQRRLEHRPSIGATTPAEAARPGGGTGEELPEVVLGCDPEFALRHSRTGRLVPASRFFTRFGVVGLDRQAVRRDGIRHYPLAELRPQPSPSPHILLNNLRQAMLRAARAVRGRNIRFQAGSLGGRSYPMGGHIHFSNLRPSTDLLRALDNYLAVPLLLLEDPGPARARRPRYGTLGDFRMQRHGGFEYRTPGSWLFTPEFALAVLCLSKVVATDFDLLRRNVLIGLDAQRDFYLAKKERFREAFPALWDDLKSVPSFRHYEADLQILHDLIEDERRWNESMDIKRAWLIGPAAPLSDSIHGALA